MATSGNVQENWESEVIEATRAVRSFSVQQACNELRPTGSHMALEASLGTDKSVLDFCPGFVPMLYKSSDGGKAFEAHLCPGLPTGVPYQDYGESRNYMFYVGRTLFFFGRYLGRDDEYEFENSNGPQFARFASRSESGYWHRLPLPPLVQSPLTDKLTFAILDERLSVHGPGIRSDTFRGQRSISGEFGWVPGWPRRVRVGEIVRRATAVFEFKTNSTEEISARSTADVLADAISMLEGQVETMGSEAIGLVGEDPFASEAKVLDDLLVALAVASEAIGSIHFRIRRVGAGIGLIKDAMGLNKKIDRGMQEIWASTVTAAAEELRQIMYYVGDIWQRHMLPGGGGSRRPVTPYIRNPVDVAEFVDDVFMTSLLHWATAREDGASVSYLHEQALGLLQGYIIV